MGRPSSENLPPNHSQLEIIPLSSPLFMFLVESKQEYWRIYPGYCDDVATLQWCHNADTGHRRPGHYSRLFIKGIKPVVCVRLCHTFSAARAALWAADKGNNSIFTSQYLHRPLVAVSAGSIVPLSLLTVSSVTSHQPPASTLYSHRSSVVT